MECLNFFFEICLICQMKGVGKLCPNFKGGVLKLIFRRLMAEKRKSVSKHPYWQEEQDIYP